MHHRQATNEAAPPVAAPQAPQRRRSILPPLFSEGLFRHALENSETERLQKAREVVVPPAATPPAAAAEPTSPVRPGEADPARGRGPPSSSSVPLMVKQTSATSVVSEMTMMTYSKEKADMLMEEFFRRMRLMGKGIYEMSDEDKHALLMEIKAEQEDEFKRQAKIVEEKRRTEEKKEDFREWMAKQEARHREGGEEDDDGPMNDKKSARRGDLLTRFKTVKLSEQMEKDRERLSSGEEPLGSPEKKYVRCKSEPDRHHRMTAGKGKEKLPGFQEIKLRTARDRAEGPRDGNPGKEARGGGLNQSLQSLHSTRTARVANTTRHPGGSAFARSLGSTVLTEYQIEEMEDEDSEEGEEKQGGKERLGGYRELKVGSTLTEDLRHGPRAEAMEARRGGLALSSSSVMTTKANNAKGRRGPAESSPNTDRYDDSGSESSGGGSEFSLTEVLGNETAEEERGKNASDEGRVPSRADGRGRRAARAKSPSASAPSGRGLMEEFGTKASAEERGNVPRRGRVPPRESGRGTLVGSGGESPGRSGDDASANIEKIIDLKLLVAEQQAAIDALNAKLHNVECTHRKARQSDQERLRAVEEENRRLARLLDEGHERERGLRGELEREREGRLRETLFGHGGGGDGEGEGKFEVETATASTGVSSAGVATLPSTGMSSIGSNSIPRIP